MRATVKIEGERGKREARRLPPVVRHYDSTRQWPCPGRLGQHRPEQLLDLLCGPPLQGGAPAALCRPTASPVDPLPGPKHKRTGASARSPKYICTAHAPRPAPASQSRQTCPGPDGAGAAHLKPRHCSALGVMSMNALLQANGSEVRHRLALTPCFTLLHLASPCFKLNAAAESGSLLAPMGTG